MLLETTVILPEDDDSDTREMVSFKVVYNKQKHDVTFPLDETVQNLKEHLKSITGVPPAMQKIMYKGENSKCNIAENLFLPYYDHMAHQLNITNVLSVVMSL